MIIAAIPKNVFFYEVEPFVSILSKYIRTLIQSVFHVVGMLYSIIDVYDLNQSIFWDTLYGENSLCEFGTKGHQKAQPHKLFFGE